MVSVDVNGSSPPKTVQLIDEDCNFKYSCCTSDLIDSDQIGSYIRDTKLEGFGYHLVAVFGSQSTGKSSTIFRASLTMEVLYSTDSLEQASMSWMKLNVNKLLKVQLRMAKVDFRNLVVSCTGIGYFNHGR